MAPVLHHTRASCTALRFAEELCGGAGTSSASPEAECARGRLRPASGLRFLLTFGLAGMLGACGQSAAANTDAADTTLRLEGSESTLETLGRHVLDALARQDTSALSAVRLTEHQHNEVIWPELPASAPEVNFPIDYAWSNIQRRNHRALTRILPLFADRTVGYQGVECRGETETFETFEVRTDCYLLFTVDDGPRRWEIQAFKDVLIRGGGHKIFRYYDEEPRPYGGPDRS